MAYICWCKWEVRTEKQFIKHLNMHIQHGDYDIPLLNGGTNKYHPWSFQNTKKLVFWRDLSICKCCGKKTDNYEIHHIRSQVEGGSNHPQNLVLLCINCHNLTKSWNNNFSGFPSRKGTPIEQRTIGSYE